MRGQKRHSQPRPARHLVSPTGPSIQPEATTSGCTQATCHDQGSTFAAPALAVAAAAPAPAAAAPSAVAVAAVAAADAAPAACPAAGVVLAAAPAAGGYNCRHHPKLQPC